jgi:alkanesulfonate monooxygenase SsuD/methylene tetrahydromethanopterin reductase-like flavin-dependent oxidoreductase (luciferase family)
MIEIGIFDNGAPDLPLVRTRDNIVVNDGTLREVHEAAQRSLIHQVRRGVLAERLGVDGFWLTEHHLPSAGPEMSPNPLSVQMDIAARTKRIRLGQCANIVVWWHPVRFAEQLAALDVLSGGRVECGIGRGYQPRENEVFGRVYNSTIQDQERNRKAYQEAVELIMQCWMQPSISHHGENFSVPPTYTKWNHKSTMAYYGLEKVERSVEDVLAIGPPDMYAAGNPVQATTTTLKEISVFPQPLQKPHPQLWEPLTSPRSIDWAAKHGVNGVFVVEPNDRLRRNIELYYQAAAKYNWPDFRNQGAFIRVEEGGAITHQALVAPCRAVACALGGADGRTLYGCVFDGELHDVGQIKGRSRLDAAKVPIGAI